MTGELDPAAAGDDHPYRTWDAAYVLGSLSSADRREFEAHLDRCPSCRTAVAELAPLPRLLSLLSRDAATGDGTGTGPRDTAELFHGNRGTE